MNHFTGVCAGLALAGPLAAGAAAQGVIMEHNLSLGLARDMAEATLAACEERGAHTSVAVVDRAGNLMVFLRHERASAASGELAQRKAMTARTFRRPSLEWAQRTEGPRLSGQRYLSDVIPLGGGVPVKVGDETIGAVASAGGPGQEADQACAEAGLAAVADRLE